MDAFELFNENQKPTGVWCCGKCRKLVLSQVYNFREGTPKSDRESAEACCRPRICTKCQAEIPNNKHRSESICDACDSEAWRIRRAEADQRRLDAAELVTDYTGPLYLDGYGGDWGDGYHSDIEHLIEEVADSEHIFDDEGRLDIDAIPEFAFPCVSSVKSLDLDRAIENLCDDGYEDMADNLTIPSSLHAAVDEFNTVNATALTVWAQDTKRKVAIRQAVIDYINEGSNWEQKRENSTEQV